MGEWQGKRRVSGRTPQCARGNNDSRRCGNTPRWRRVVAQKKNGGHSGRRRQRTATPGQEHSHANRQAARLPARGVTSSEGSPPPPRRPPSPPRWRSGERGQAPASSVVPVARGPSQRLTTQTCKKARAGPPPREPAGGVLVCGTLIGIHLDLADGLGTRLTDKWRICNKILIRDLNQSEVKLNGHTLKYIREESPWEE